MQAGGFLQTLWLSPRTDWAMVAVWVMAVLVLRNPQLQAPGVGTWDKDGRTLTELKMETCC
jgi:hypothetical protein